MIVEVKGELTSSDRKKMLFIKEQYPDRKIVMLFGRAKNKLYRGSPTTYSDWCDQKGLAWIDYAEFRKNPECLFAITPKQKNGALKKPLRKNSTQSSKLVKKPSSKA